MTRLDNNYPPFVPPTLGGGPLDLQPRSVKKPEGGAGYGEFLSDFGNDTGLLAVLGLLPGYESSMPRELTQREMNVLAKLCRNYAVRVLSKCKFERKVGEAELLEWLAKLKEKAVEKDKDAANGRFAAGIAQNTVGLGFSAFSIGCATKGAKSGFDKVKNQTDVKKIAAQGEENIQKLNKQHAGKHQKPGDPVVEIGGKKDASHPKPASQHDPVEKSEVPPVSNQQLHGSNDAGQGGAPKGSTTSATGGKTDLDSKPDLKSDDLNPADYGTDGLTIKQRGDQIDASKKAGKAELKEATASNMVMISNGAGASVSAIIGAPLTLEADLDQAEGQELHVAAEKSDAILAKSNALEDQENKVIDGVIEMGNDAGRNINQTNQHIWS